MLADTHAWMWWLFSSNELSQRARVALNEAELVLVPAICLWEVAMLVDRRRLPVIGTAREVLRRALLPGRIDVVPLGPEIAARSVELGTTVHGDPADRLIAATALELALPLVTRDIKIARMPGVETLW